MPYWMGRLLMLALMVNVQGQRQQQAFLIPPHPFILEHPNMFLGIDKVSLAFLTRYLNDVDKRVLQRQRQNENHRQDSSTQAIEDPMDQRHFPTSFRSPLLEKYKIVHDDDDDEHDQEGGNSHYHHGCHHCNQCQNEAASSEDSNNIFFDSDSMCSPQTCNQEDSFCSHHDHDHNAVSEGDGNDVHLSVECVCGSCKFDFSIDPCTRIEYCHCRNCRKYTIAPFASYIQASNDSIKQVLRECRDMPLVKSAIAPCLNSTSTPQHYERWHCQHCLAPILSVKKKKNMMDEDKDDEGNAEVVDSIHVAAGSIVEKSIPDNVSLFWHSNRGQNHKHDFEKVIWLNEVSDMTLSADTGHLPQISESSSRQPMKITGGCSCGDVRYKAIVQHRMNFQHCYCRLCRQCSGSAYQTWVPFHMSNVVFTETKGMKAIRTTLQGQRHFCSSCGGTLTIQYDGQADILWLAAGGFDDDSLPQTKEEIRQRLFDVAHICCEWMQPWYILPDDNAPRKKLAA